MKIELNFSAMEKLNFFLTTK